jgi:hypothetical protein
MTWTTSPAARCAKCAFDTGRPANLIAIYVIFQLGLSATTRIRPIFHRKVTESRYPSMRRTALVLGIAALLPALVGPLCGPPPKTGPRINGIAPNEALDGDRVWIAGRGFNLNGPHAVALRDEVSGQTWPVTEVSQIMESRMRVKLPNTGHEGRRLFSLIVADDNIVHPAANKLFIRKNNQTRPEGEFVHLRLVRWRPAWLCDRNAALQEAPPYVCNCFRWPVIPLTAVELGLYNPNPADSWSNAGWEDFLDHYKDAENEWSSVCGEVWTGNAASWYAGSASPATTA